LWCRLKRHNNLNKYKGKTFLKVINVMNTNSSKITTISELGKKVAMLTSNRNLDSKAVKAKAASLKDMEQLVPAVIVDATKAAAEGLGMVDFVTGNEIPENELENYVVLVDGNHRYKAYLNLKKMKGYSGEYWVTYPLPAASNKKVADMIAEINIATNPWKGSDYSKCAYMVMGDKSPIGVEAMNELTYKGCNISSASLWLVFGKEINKAVLTKAMKGDISSMLYDDDKIKRGLDLYHTAEEAGFSGEFLGKRTFIEWIKKTVTFGGKIDNEKVKQMKVFITSLKDKVKEIEGTKGEDGLNKELTLHYKLTNLWDIWLETMPTVEPTDVQG
jgi:hypothetical protein